MLLFITKEEGKKQKKGPEMNLQIYILLETGCHQVDCSFLRSASDFTRELFIATEPLRFELRY